MSDPLGSLFVSWIGYVPNFFGDIPRNFYTTTGATISATDRVSVVNSATAIALTLPAGPRDGCPLIIKNFGAGTLTLTATIDGTAGTTSVTSLEHLSLIWSNTLSTWLSV